MIEFFLGKTGAGKSYLALKRIVEFLASSSDGYVLTNLSIDVGKLNVWMKLAYPHLEPDCVARIRRLDDMQCRLFYLYREPGVNLLPVTKQEENELVFPDFDAAAQRSQHVLYVIDEAHIFFDAREWAKVGATLNFFCSQHRKFRSDIVFITQFLDQVEKRLRNHATQFSECQNWSTRRWGLWKLPQVFRVRLTYKAPPCPSEHTETYSIDKTLADCYDTTAGVGVAGGRAPERQRRKGWPFWTLPALACVLVAFFWFTPDLLVGGALNAVGGATAKVAKPESAVSARTDTTGPVRQPDTKAQADTGSQALQMRGWAVRGGRAIVQLSDGRRLTERDAEFGGLQVRGNAVIVGGEKVWMRQPDWNGKVVEPPKARPEPTQAIINGFSGEAVIPTPESAALQKTAPALPAVKMSDSGGNLTNANPARGVQRR